MLRLAGYIKYETRLEAISFGMGRNEIGMS